MPVDKAGKFHLNTQKAHAADRMPGMPKPKQPEGMTPAEPAAGAPHATVHDHGDGTGHTEMADGTQHDHSDMEGLKAKLDQLLQEESSEGSPMDGGGSHQMHHDGY